MLTITERTAINATRLAAKRARTFYPTARDMLERKAVVARVHSFENLNFVAEARAALLSGNLDDKRALEFKTLVRATLWKARRNAESAKFLGLGLYSVLPPLHS